MIPTDVRDQLLRGARSYGLLALGAFVALTLGFLQLLGAAERGVSGEDGAVPEFTASPPAATADAAIDPAAIGAAPEPEGARGEEAGAGDVGILSAPDAGAPADASPAPPAMAPPPAGWRVYRDAVHGLALMLPEGWREAAVEPAGELAALLPDHDVVFESPDGGQRLAVSTWGAAERPPFAEFAASAVAGMQPVDGLWPTNAFVAGVPALVVGAPEAPTTPLSYAVLLEHDDRYHRIAWSAYDGARDATVFARALATLAWTAVADPAAPADGALDALRPLDAPMVPRLDLPSGVYFPSEALFGAPAP